MIDWLLADVTIPRYGWMLMLGWLFWCQISWLDARKKVKTLEYCDVLMRRILHTHEPHANWRKDDPLPKGGS